MQGKLEQQLRDGYLRGFRSAVGEQMGNPSCDKMHAVAFDRGYFAGRLALSDARKASVRHVREILQGIELTEPERAVLRAPKGSRWKELD